MLTKKEAGAILAVIMDADPAATARTCFFTPHERDAMLSAFSSGCEKLRNVINFESESAQNSAQNTVCQAPKNA